MSNLNCVVVSGNLVKDCEKKKAGETPIIEFTIANNEWRKSGDSAESFVNFIDCTMFGKRVQKLSEYMTKGTKVTVLGHLRQQRWEKDGQKRSKLTLIVEEVELLFPKSEESDNAKDDIPW